MTKASQSKAAKGSSGEHTMCRVKPCGRATFSDGLCHVHGLQEYYGHAKADVEVTHAVVGSMSRSKG